MPSAIMHRAVAKIILQKVKLFTNPHDAYLYEVGVIAPDSWRNCARFKNSTLSKMEKRQSSHFSKPGSWLEYYDDFYNKYKNYLDNPFMFGYFVHLMTDHIAHQDMLYQKLFKNKVENPLLSEQKAKMVTSILCKKLDLSELRLLSKSEITALPRMAELEYDGINSTINFTNGEIKDALNAPFIDNEIEFFIEEIEHWSDIIMTELEKYKAPETKKNE